MTLDLTKARKVLHEEAARVDASNVDPDWVNRVEELSAACEAINKTFIAALGTGLLAKATDLGADPLALKAGATSRGAYSARRLCHSVLAPEAAALEIDLGVTGREPLNNQPFFRYDVISLDMAVRNPAALEMLVSALEAAARIASKDEACTALRSFLLVRRRVVLPSLPLDAGSPATAVQLVELIRRFVAADSEGGRRAQGAAAGVLDACIDHSLVRSQRINDPDRHLPGDIGILASHDGDQWLMVVEVRDKPVTIKDVGFALRKAMSADVPRVAVLAVADGQEALDASEHVQHSAESGVLLRVFYGWEGFVEGALFWSNVSPIETINAAYRRIDERLRELEVSAGALAAWADWRSLHGQS